MQDRLRRIKSEIISCTIPQDQQRVAQQWLQTFKHNDDKDPASNMAKMLVACVAEGDFKVATALAKDTSLQAPLAHLSNVDYLSHASRIIIDFQGLTELQQEEFLSYFPDPTGENGVVSRVSTHAVVREDTAVKELKGFMLGVGGQLPAWLKTPHDFGVNIAMGGVGQENFVGNTISNNGFSGHMYFYKLAEQNLVMAGLEQSAPAGGLRDVLFGHADNESEDTQKGHDQFEQGHSLVGASDTYTAAGSLYFSDPVYQAKLLDETGTMPPEKYGAMQVTINAENWPLIKNFLVTMQHNIVRKNDDALSEQLCATPKSAEVREHALKSYIALDFKTYLKRIEVLLEGEDIDLPFHRENMALILEKIEQMQSGETNGLEPFRILIGKLLSQDNRLPKSYKQAIQRISRLVERQIDLDPNLLKTNNHLLYQSKAEILTSDLHVLENRLNELLDFYASPYIVESEQVSSFLAAMQKGLNELSAIRDSLSYKRHIAQAETEDLSGSILIQEALQKSWQSLGDSLSLRDLDNFEEQLSQLNALISTPPALSSNEALQAFQCEKKDMERKLQEAVQFEQQLDAEKNALLEQYDRDLTALNATICEQKHTIPQGNAERSLLLYSLEQEICRLNGLLQEKEKEKSVLAEQLGGMERRVDHLEKASNSGLSGIEILPPSGNDASSDIEQERRALSDELAGLREELERTKTKAAADRDISHKAFQARIESLETQMLQQAQIIVQKEDAITVQKALLSQEKERLQGVIDVMTQEKEALEGTSSEQEAALAEVRQALEEVTREKEALEDASSDQDEALSEARQALEDMTREKEALEDSSSEQEEALSEARQALEDMAQNHAALELSSSEQEEALSELRDTLEKIESEHADAMAAKEEAYRGDKVLLKNTIDAQEKALKVKEQQLRVKTLKPALHLFKKLEKEVKHLNAEQRPIAEKLITALWQEADTYITQEGDDLTRFKENCQQHIMQDMGSLQQNDGWSHVIKEVLACIATLVVPYLLAGVVNLAVNGNMGFFKAKSADMHHGCEAIKSTLDELETDSDVFEDLPSFSG